MKVKSVSQIAFVLCLAFIFTACGDDVRRGLASASIDVFFFLMLLASLKLIIWFVKLAIKGKDK